MIKDHHLEERKEGKNKEKEMTATTNERRDFADKEKELLRNEVYRIS